MGGIAIKGKNLIVYYSHSGNTDRIAKTIHNKIGGDILRIEPIKPYPRDYDAVVKQAKKEITSGYIPELKSYIHDISSYKNIFIGSPNWWSTIAPPVGAFLLQHDLANKTVIPFCTHGGGGKGKVFSDVAKKCSSSKIKKGLEIYGSGDNKVEKVIEDWLYGIS